MRNAEYSVHLMNFNGALLADLSDFYAIEYTRTINSIGALVLTVPGFLSDVRRDQMITVYRSIRGLPQVLDANTVWFVNGIEFDGESGTTRISASDTLSLIKRRIVAYPSRTPEGTKTMDEGVYLNADDLIKSFVRENMGSLATDPFRRMTNLYVDSDLSIFPFAEKDGAWRNLLDTITEIASEQADSGRSLIFDLVPESGGLAFRFSTYDTFLGSDRRATAQFGPDYGNMLNAKMEVDWTEFTSYVYVGGDGEDDLRWIEEVSSGDFDLSPYARSEAFIDMRDEIDEAVMQSEARAYMKSRRARRKLSGTIVDGAGLYYGIDYFFGDYVRATFAGVLFDAVIQSIDVSVDGDGEEVKVVLSGDS